MQSMNAVKDHSTQMNGIKGGDWTVFDFEKMFITDQEKMYDFKKLSRTEFLESYSYLTEEEYDETARYVDWLMKG